MDFLSQQCPFSPAQIIDNWKKVFINWDAIEMARHWTEIAMGKAIE
jgi:hypothetical protein